MDLGRLETVDVRSVWPHEAHQFTPWLLANADVLADALGIELELQAAEHPVGGFSLDLLGRDFTHDAVLIVENQLGITDHLHLGQIVTYAAGTDARTVVWVATGFREEHRQALDWLNEHTIDDLRFFGVQAGVVRIGASHLAPLFQLVAKPNDWQRTVRSAASNQSKGSRSAAYLAFWTAYLEAVATRHPEWGGARRTPSDQNWMDWSSPVRGIRINVSFARGDRLRHELYLDTGDPDSTLALYQRTEAQRPAFEAAFGGELEWEPLQQARACRIAVYREAGVVTDTAQHLAYIEWFIDTGERLRRALGVVDLDPASPNHSVESGLLGERSITQPSTERATEERA